MKTVRHIVIALLLLSTLAIAHKGPKGWDGSPMVNARLIAVRFAVDSQDASSVYPASVSLSRSHNDVLVLASGDDVYQVVFQGASPFAGKAYTVRPGHNLILFPTGSSKVGSYKYSYRNMRTGQVVDPRVIIKD